MGKYFIIYDSNIEVCDTPEELTKRIEELVNDDGYSINQHDFSNNGDVVGNESIVVVFGKQITVKNTFTIVQ